MMEITLKTDVLKDMVSRVAKGASNNRLIPITSLMGIMLEAGELTLITTDATNYVYIRQSGIVGEDFRITVPVDVFTKLIARTTSENVVLKIDSDILVVAGNGEYKIELPMDEDGTLVKFPDPLRQVVFDPEDTKEINLSTISVILSSMKSALAVTLEDPCYTGYYVGESIIATDTYKIASMKVSHLFGEDVLVSSEMMNLLSVMSSEKISVDRHENIIVFGSPDCTIYGTVLEGIEDYAVNEISQLIDMEFESKCKIPKNRILQVLDRLALFVNIYDKNGVFLTFMKSGLQIESKTSTGIEIIPYFESVNFKPFTCCIDIEMFISQLKAQTNDMVELHYGLDNAIKIVDGNMIHIIALLEDDRELAE